MPKEVVFTGQGGQGILLVGDILTKTAFADGQEVAYTLSYGAATRGEGSNLGVVISDKAIDFPGVMTPDILAVMSQEGYDAWISKVSLGTKVFFDIDTVKTIQPAKAAHIPVPASRVAADLGSRVAANMVILGAMVAITRLVFLSNLFEVIKKDTGRFAEINLDAIREGYKLGKKYLMKKR